MTSPTVYDPHEILLKIKGRELSARNGIVKPCNNCGCGMKKTERDTLKCCNFEAEEK